MNQLKKLLPFLLLSCMSQTALAGEQWYVSTSISAMPGTYSGSEQRSDLLSTNLILNADYLDKFSFALAYNNFKINFKDTGAGAFKVNQNAIAARLQYHAYSSALSGKLTAQLVAHSISNDDATTLSDDVSVIAPKIAYTNMAKDLYLDFEYVNSSYPNNGNLKIQQYTPSIGFALNNKADWLQFKAFLINSSDKALSQNEDSLSSLSINWTHWFAPGAILGIDSFFTSVLAGQRIYAVDNDSFSVYNLADVQQGSLVMGLNWKSGENTDISFIAGNENYENKTISNDYKQQYIYISLTQHW